MRSLGWSNSELEVFSFIFISHFKHCYLSLKLISFVLNVSKYYTICSLTLAQLHYSIKSGHMDSLNSSFLLF
ncbi:hypothetical protein Hanom_Chr14g01253011 [Helianthus anomalus]